MVAVGTDALKVECGERSAIVAAGRRLSKYAAEARRVKVAVGRRAAKVTVTNSGIGTLGLAEVEGD